MTTALEQLGTRVGGDAVSISAALQAVVAIAALLLQLPLRGRRSRLLQGLSIAVVLAAVVALTVLFAVTVRVVLSNGTSVDVFATSFSLRFAPEDGLWTLVREVPISVWRTVSICALVSLYLFAMLVTLVTPVAPTHVPRAPPKRVNSAMTNVNRENVPASQARCDCNRVWLNMFIVIVVLGAVGAFSGVVISTRTPVADGAALFKENALAKANRRKFERFTDISPCVCQQWPNCLGEPRSNTECGFTLVAPHQHQQLFECLTGVKNVNSAAETTIVHALDNDCASGANGRSVLTRFAGVVVGAQFLILLLLAVFFVLQWPLLFTTAFLLSAYIVAVVLLVATLPVVLALDAGPVNNVFGISRKSLFLVTATGPVALRMARVVVACVFAQMMVSFVAAITEWRRLEWTLSIYTILRLKQNNDTYDHYVREEDADPDARL